VLRRLPIGELTIEDERAFRHVGLYQLLKNRLVADGALFAVAEASLASEDAIRLLNLAFYKPGDVAEILVDPVLSADQLMHSAWHHVVARALGPAARTTAGLQLAESIASAFDVYLLGRLLGHAPDSAFLETQVPAMADATLAAGLEADDFEALLARVSSEPEKAFGDLRALLYDVSMALSAAPDADAAAKALVAHAAHPFAPLLHHYELPTWVLFARAYADESASDEAARVADGQLRDAADPMAWLESNWLT
jgi:hypothetical protein